MMRGRAENKLVRTVGSRFLGALCDREDHQDGDDRLWHHQQQLLGGNKRRQHA